MSVKRRGVAVLAAVAVAAGLAACGSSSSNGAGDGAKGGSPGTTSLHVGETAGMPSAFLEFGKAEGFFAEHHIDIDVDTSTGGAAVIPAVVSGSLDIAGSNAVSSILAGSKGLPVKVIAPGTFATDDPSADFSAVIVSKDSGIHRPADLAGKTIAVNTLKNIGDITITAALRKDGVDTSGIKYVELGFPDMLAAVKNKQVDAAWIIEPFLTKGLSQGDRPVLRPYVETQKGLEVGTYVTSTSFMQKHPDVVADFQAAVAETAKKVTDDPDAFRQSLVKTQGMDAALAKAVTLPQYKQSVDLSSLQVIADQMRQDGYVDTPVDVAGLVAAK